MSSSTMHRRIFERMLAREGEVLEVRQPTPAATATQTPTAAEMFFGPRPAAPAAAPTGPVDEVTALITTDPATLSVEGLQRRTPFHGIGRPESIVMIARCLLPDALVDDDRPLGRTLFDTAKDVVYLGESFEVAGTERTGLPGAGPYILWVALRRRQAAP
jgi:hypothetical protein